MCGKENRPSVLIHNLAVQIVAVWRCEQPSDGCEEMDQTLRKYNALRVKVFVIGRLMSGLNGKCLCSAVYLFLPHLTEGRGLVGFAAFSV